MIVAAEAKIKYVLDLLTFGRGKEVVSRIDGVRSDHLEWVRYAGHEYF